MGLRLDPWNRQLYDGRRRDDILFDKQAFSVCYTRLSDDITVGPKPANTPYLDRRGELQYDGEKFSDAETGTVMTFEAFHDGILFSMRSDASDLSEYGVNLSFNFMGKLNGGGWQNQFLFNTPYISQDRSVLYVYLTKPNGAHLCVTVPGGAAGWKMDYSPYLGGQYFLNLKLLANFDRAYRAPRRENVLTFCIFPVEDFSDCLQKLADIYAVPFLDYDISGGRVGTSVRLKAYGEIDRLLISNAGNVREEAFDPCFTVDCTGETEITPLCKGVKGAPVTVYGYEDLTDLYKRSMDTVDLAVVAQTDGNLCEHQCWAAAMLRFLLRYRDRLFPEEISDYEQKLKSLLRVVTETDIRKAVPRRTILDHACGEYPAYNIFQSRRIKEEFFGITLLLDAYRYFQDETYYRYAVCTTDSLIEHYQKPDGRFETNGEDYSTVCCVMIPLADMANFLVRRDKARSERYFAAASRLAAYLYERGTSFPTEGGSAEGLAEPVMEDGSTSCTALALLYYCLRVREDRKYLARAKEVLDLHENWVMRAPVCQMKASSLRWWETKWEGDADGPAICAGHAWTIWRAEADFLYYRLTGEQSYLRRAWNGFMTNLSKIDETGRSYSIYNPDMINGGGFADRADDVVFRIANRFADRQDCGLSRYVWIRMADTFLSGT